jgi:hypothetical protein
MTEIEITENSAEVYYEKLVKSTNPGLILAQFFGNVFSRSIGKTEVILFNRLLRIYGRFVVYFSILDLTSMKELDFNQDLYGILSYFAKKRLDQKYGIVLVESNDLNRFATSVAKQIEKQKKEKLIIPELD